MGACVAITSAFISEHCLPFSIAKDLLSLAKRLSEDRLALEKAALSKTSATYITTHGIAKSFKEEVKLKIKGQMVSLNLDEATSNSNDKVLNVIIQYFDREENKIELRHLGTRTQNKSSAKDILDSVESILMEYEIQWNQILSVMMDNCSTMRGARGGVETLIWKNPYLQDISGDSVHMLNNVAKALLSNVDDSVQMFCSDLFYDIEEFPKVKHLFQEVQELLNITATKHLIRPISSRFLQIKDVMTRVLSLLDSLTVYYYSFLSEEEKTKYRSVISQIFSNHQVSDEAQASVILLQISQEKQQKSVTSTERKDRILDYLFSRRNETETKLHLFRGLLDTFSEYIQVVRETLNSHSPQQDG
ncbi:uncharacterized protein LOC123549137 [Mercenaria mercenaria]|uniref:uncharacterized protein LOC123549137 n=1 Tax=Mercenaria mercenaria TaxID=6596 RepID=UPI00234F1B3F|nr:uncharacterized protein LOC123549137 [Mercenaria mercenaria]XP_053402608.1 uncharacterized protein LOC123549137 [Mercenaria mercenaria]